MNCPLCFQSMRAKNKSLGWYACRRHIEIVNVLFDKNGKPIVHKSCLTFNCQQYRFLWNYENKLSIWCKERNAYLIHDSNIPILSPEQAPALLQRVLANLAFA